jgi:hypothetical protein
MEKDNVTRFPEKKPVVKEKGSLDWVDTPVRRDYFVEPPTVAMTMMSTVSPAALKAAKQRVLARRRAKVIRDLKLNEGLEHHIVAQGQLQINEMIRKKEERGEKHGMEYYLMLQLVVDNT